MPKDIPPSRQPSPWPLRRGAVLRCYVRGGTRLYVAEGDVLLLGPPRVVAGEVHRTRSALAAGHVHVVGEAGWIELQAPRAATLLWLASGEVRAAVRIKGILSAWLRSWRRRSARPSPRTTSA